MSWQDMLVATVKSGSPVTKQVVDSYTEEYMKHEDELTADESDTIDALLRILEERVVDESVKATK